MSLPTDLVIVHSEGTGRIDVGELRNVLGNLGERLTYEESASSLSTRGIALTHLF